jgi:hypothetical protein
MLKAFLYDLEWIPFEWVFGGWAAGAILGVLAASLAVRRYLKEV